MKISYAACMDFAVSIQQSTDSVELWNSEVKEHCQLKQKAMKQSKETPPINIKCPTLYHSTLPCLNIFHNCLPL